MSGPAQPTPLLPTAPLAVKFSARELHLLVTSVQDDHACHVERSTGSTCVNNLHACLLLYRKREQPEACVRYVCTCVLPGAITRASICMYTRPCERVPVSDHTRPYCLPVHPVSDNHKQKTTAPCTPWRRIINVDGTYSGRAVPVVICPGRPRVPKRRW